VVEVESVPARVEPATIPGSQLDLALTAQLVVAWAGEAGESKRMGWWKSDLVSEFGGEDLFRRLLPATWRWAVLQAAREAARRKDLELRRQDHDPDRIVSLFCLGFELDERLEERLQSLKGSGRLPDEALPGLDLLAQPWSRSGFHEWLQGHGDARHTPTPAGRKLDGAPPAGLDALVKKLVAGLAPLSDSYPLPHFRRTT
jgi:hypothetical protein